MPYFTIVEGKFTQLCVHTAQEQPCPNPQCEKSHEPKKRRICPLFHNPRERCPHNPCLLGHDEARDALKASKAFGRCQRLAKQQEDLLMDNAQNPTTETNTGPKTGDQPASAQKEEASHPPPIIQNPKPQTEKQTETGNGSQSAPPVHFQQLVKENEGAGRSDEMKRICLLTESLKGNFEAFKRRAEEKDAAKQQEVRSLQEAMGEMCSKNEALKEDNDSKASVLDAYYKDVLRSSLSTRSLLDLEKMPPSETAIEGTLVVLKTMFTKPVEFEGASNIIDMFSQRSKTRFSDQVATLQSLGMTSAKTQHALFLRCYMRFPIDPSFCLNGILDNTSSVVSISRGGTFPPKASILKKTPRKFRRAFLAQSALPKVSEVANTSLSLQKGGGLTNNEPLPSEVHTLLATFCHGEFFKNPSVPLVPQFISYIQNELSELDEVLLKYLSPVYKACPLKLREYKNGRKEIIKNKDHPVYEKWEPLINRIHFSTSYATTRLTFPWKGFYLPGGRVSSHRDKYASFAFVYTTDLTLGALPLWPLDVSSHYQLDRKDPLRHYTLYNVRWLERSDKMANKPSLEKDNGTLIQTTKDVLKILHTCERNNLVCIEMLGTLIKGYGT
jgi:hypothetical protein